MAENRSFSSSTYGVQIIPSEDLRCRLKKDYQNDIYKEEMVSFDTIRTLAKTLEKSDNDDRHIHQLLNGSVLCFSQPPVPPRNPELEARIKEIKKKLEQQEYERMTESVDATIKAKYVENFSSDARILRSHMTASLNFVITVGACFLFGYKVVEFMLPSAELAAKFLFGIVTGLIGGAADLYFLIKHLDHN